MAITNAENDDVALVPLDVLEVLDEQTDELAVLFTFALGFDEAAKFPVVAGQLLERLFDFALLGFGKGDDADRKAGLAS